MPRRQLHDRYFRQAKREGYLARSAYKLLEIQERHRVLREGQTVLDLGCAPGSWLQVASELVGPQGRVLGIDLQRVTHPMPPQVRTLEGDAFTHDPSALIQLAGQRFDAILSDMAPKTSGNGDDLVSAQLCRQVLDGVPKLGKPGSALVMKIFEGAEYQSVLDETRRMYTTVKGLRPKATRDVSREIFIIGTGLRYTEGDEVFQ